MLLRDDAALVTGVGSPIGRALAKAIAREGGKLVGTDINVEQGHKAIRDITADGGTASFVPADLADENAPQQIFDFASAQMGRISVFVHCASPHHFGRTLAQSTEQDWARMFGVNVFSVYRLTRLLGAHMSEGTIRGRMLLVTSLHADSVRHVPHYSGSKSALTMLMRELAVDLGRVGVRVNALAPGMIAPVQLPVHEPFARASALRRIGTPEEFANTGVAILSERFASFITGVVIPVDGGLSLFNWMPRS